MTIPTDPDTDRSVPPQDAPPRGGTAKRVPPLAWIILALLLVMLAVGMSQWGGNHRTVGGGDTPMKDPAQAEQAIMPATPPPAQRPDDQATPQTRTTAQ